MTSLASVLADPARAAVLQVAPEASVADVERAVIAAGGRFALVESEGAADKAAVMESFAEGLDLPDWFGRNLDALVDSLNDVGVDDAPTVVLWDRPDAFEAGDPEQYAQVLDILAERAGDLRLPRLVALIRRELRVG
ncbi:MAG: barstar family protein [Microthrixaceae bacterium]|nr:barstar family protein [Microthrixaceae bacterium]